MEPRALKLVMLKGLREGETLEYRPGFKIRLGRIVRCNNLPIKDPGISTNHLTIDSDDSGKWVLRDLDSSNGTIVNDTNLTPLYLNDGDEIKIGELTSISVTIVYHEESRLGRNPKRGATATKAEKTIAESRGRRGRGAKETELKVEKKEEQIGGAAIEAAAAPVVRNEMNSELEKEAEKIEVAKKLPRGRPKRARVLKSEEPVEEVANEEERIGGAASKEAAAVVAAPFAQNEVNSELEKEAEMIEVAKKPLRARPKRDRVLSEEPVEEVAVPRGVTRRSKNAASVSALAETMENCSSECEEVKKVEPKTRRGRKKNVADERPVSDKIDVPEQNDLVEMVELDAKGDVSDDDKFDLPKQNDLVEMVEVDAKGDDDKIEVPEHEGLGEIDAIDPKDDGCGDDDKVEVPEHEGLGEIDAVGPKDDGCGDDDKVEVPEHEGLGKIDAIDPKSDDGDEDHVEAVIDADVGGSGEMDESGNRCCSGVRGAKDVNGNESVKGWSAKVGLELDLEAMTLKDWFEYVEYSWPEVVNDEIDKVCMEMRETAKRVQEYIAQNKKENGHGQRKELVAPCGLR